MQEAIRSSSVGSTVSYRTRALDSAEWVGYFQRNDHRLAIIPWELGAELSDEERNAIAKSVQAFQLGESSEGRHLQHCADQWGMLNRDAHYPLAIQLFIKEEQRHARELGRFLETNGVGLIRKDWSDSLFRKIRHLASLELSIMVLLTAEIVAQVYYVALRESTNSIVLKTICNQILKDEEEHVRFQCERLAIIGRPQNWIRLTLRYCVQRALMLGALPIVWHGHHKAYKTDGFNFGRFASETWLAFSRAVPRMHPNSYETA